VGAVRLDGLAEIIGAEPGAIARGINTTVGTSSVPGVAGIMTGDVETGVTGSYLGLISGEGEVFIGAGAGSARMVIGGRSSSFHWGIRSAMVITISDR
jgi:hypothetical protein